MFEGLFATGDKHFGRVGSPLVAGGLGAGAGAGVAHLIGKSIPMGAAIGAGSGVAGAELGRALFTDKVELNKLKAEDLEKMARELRKA
jgi:4-diphosphocytidyl-2C-methyl-D-erythritol kinase